MSWSENGDSRGGGTGDGGVEKRWGGQHDADGGEEGGGVRFEIGLSYIFLPISLPVLCV